jgi:3',5'-cyclic AMP phosphodiesterase CpdA
MAEINFRWPKDRATFNPVSDRHFANRSTPKPTHMKKLFFFFATVCIATTACKKDTPGNEDHSNKARPASLKIAVVSDIHYMAPSLLQNGAVEGQAFQEYLNQDPKLLQYSATVFQTVMEDLKAERPDVLLVPGDLTKDGEMVSHQAVAEKLAQLAALGTRVLVIPGNHDLNNAKAVQYNGNTATSLPRTMPKDFEKTYKGLGYQDGSEQDPASLSYLAKTYKDLWFLAIDASKYEEYGPSGDVADGRIKDATMTWILKKLEEAKKQNATVFALMHQNLIEHYANQTQLDPGYVIDDWQNKVKALIDAGLRVIFTGHYHANDITAYEHNGKTLYDIETGSLVTAPMPYRVMQLQGNTFNIKTKTVQSIGQPMPDGVTFPAYSNQFLSHHLDSYFTELLQNRFGAPAALAQMASPLFRNGIMAHFAGDEQMPPDQQAQINALGGYSADLAGIATILWTDLGVADNNVTLQYQQ